MSKRRRVERKGFEAFNMLMKGIEGAEKQIADMNGQGDQEVSKVPLTTSDELIQRRTNEEEKAEAQRRMDDPAYARAMQTITRIKKQMVNQVKRNVRST